MKRHLNQFSSTHLLVTLWFPATMLLPNSVRVVKITHNFCTTSLPAACLHSLSLSFSGLKWPLCSLLRPQRPAGGAQERGVCDRHQRLHAREKDQTGDAAQSVDVSTNCMVLETLLYLNETSNALSRELEYFCRLLRETAAPTIWSLGL